MIILIWGGYFGAICLLYTCINLSTSPLKHLKMSTDSSSTRIYAVANMRHAQLQVVLGGSFGWTPVISARPSEARGLQDENHLHTGRRAPREDPAVESHVHLSWSLTTVMGEIRYLKSWRVCLGLHG